MRTRYHFGSETCNLGLNQISTMGFWPIAIRNQFRTRVSFTKAAPRGGADAGKKATRLPFPQTRPDGNVLEWQWDLRPSVTTVDSLTSALGLSRCPRFMRLVNEVCVDVSRDGPEYSMWTLEFLESPPDQRCSDRRDCPCKSKYHLPTVLYLLSHWKAEWRSYCAREYNGFGGKLQSEKAPESLPDAVYLLYLSLPSDYS